MKRTRLQLDIPKPVRALIERIAKREGRSMTEVIRRAVEAYAKAGIPLDSPRS